MGKLILRKVISASRRLDLVAGYPSEMAQLLATKCPPEKVHTLVIWTKDATHLFQHSALNAQIRKYDQLFVHFTITGMGGTELEPHVPATTVTLPQLNPLLDLVGDPARIRFRFDPIVHLIAPNDQPFTNFPIFETLARPIAHSGITQISISWMSVYRKVQARLLKHGYRIQCRTPEAWQQEVQLLEQVAATYHFTLHYCSMVGLPISRCIDGSVLTKLHPRGLACSEKRATGQRHTCGCTASWDVGWYFPCVHGCLYCYGNPADK